MPPVPKEPLPPTIRVAAWSDPLVENQGHSVLSSYVETFWLPILGPTTVFLARRLVRMVSVKPLVEVDCERLALSLGISPSLAKTEPMARSVRRLIGFGAAKRASGNIEIRTHLGDVPRERLDKLPPFLRDEHRRRRAAAG